MCERATGFYCVTEDDDWMWFSTLAAAESEAAYWSSEGVAASVVHVRAHVPALYVDLCAYNGVTPGIDFPATM